jgi:hypothetical protein
MGTSPTIKKIALLNLGINLEKYEHPFLIKDLNPGGEVLPQETQLAELYTQIAIMILVC